MRTVSAAHATGVKHATYESGIAVSQLREERYSAELQECAEMLDE